MNRFHFGHPGGSKAGAMLFSITDLKKTLEPENLFAFAWLVADGILNFKLAMPRNKRQEISHCILQP
jgi:hypothetical protein